MKVSILLDVNTEKAWGIFGNDSLQSFGFVDLKGLFLSCWVFYGQPIFLNELRVFSIVFGSGWLLWNSVFLTVNLRDFCQNLVPLLSKLEWMN